MIDLTDILGIIIVIGAMVWGISKLKKKSQNKKID